MTYEEIIGFHGHDCPGLAIGYRMACAGLEALSSVRAKDEELVAIVENNACGVDALQCVTGCTFGKGNLLFRDYGKQVYTIYCRSTRSGVRVVFHGRGIPEDVSEDRSARAAWILNAPAGQIMDIVRVSVSEPEPARIFESTPCAICGEMVMEPRLRRIGQQSVCIPCFEKQQKEPREGPS